MAAPYQIMNSNTTEPMGVGQHLQNLPELRKCGFVKECECANSVRILNIGISEYSHVVDTRDNTILN
jgi:hypothetical protein